jgi:hypothetical protein
VHWYSAQDASDTYMHEMWPSIEWMVTDWISAWTDGTFEYEANGVVISVNTAP